MAALWIIGCDGPVTIADAGADDGGPSDDGGLARDAGPGDAGVGADAGSDAGPAGCEIDGCGEGEACVRSVCIADCGGDVSGFEAALGAGFVPVAHFCRGPSAFAAREDGGDVTVFDLTAATAGTVTTFSLSRWALDPATPTPALAVVGTMTFDAEDTGALAFAGGYLELDPDGAQALFGYTTSATGSPGQIFRMSLADGTGYKEVAPGNFDAAWVDAEHYLVNGFGLASLADGQGLYAADLTVADRAVHIGTDFGAYSGSVAVGPTFILAAGVGDDFAGHAYLVPRATYEAALADGTPVDLGALSEVLDPAGAPIGSTFSLVHGRLVTMPYGGPITSYATAVEGDAMTLSDPRVLATGVTFTDAIAAGEGQLLLARYDASTFAVASLLLVRE
jgi:hypothetical protein